MTDDTPSKLALAFAEIDRLRARIAEFETERVTLHRSLSCRSDQLYEMGLQRTRLEKRILELETEQAVTFGTLAQPTPDEATTIVHDVKPSAPPHNE